MATESEILKAAPANLTDAQRILIWLQLANLSQNHSNSARYNHYMGMVWAKILNGIGT